MAERAPIADRMAAARALTSAQTGSSSSASSPTQASTPATSSASSGTAESPAGGKESSTSETPTESAPSETIETSAAGSRDASEAQSESDSGDGPSFGSDKERIDAAALALEKGDLAGVQTALGRQVKLTAPSVQAFKALSTQRKKHDAKVKKDQEAASRTQGELARAKGEIHQDSVRLSNARRDLDSRYGWIGQTERAWEAGDMVGFAKGIERMAKGASLATITQRIANAHMGKSEPLTQEQRQLEESRALLRKEQEDWNKRQAEEKTAREKEQGQRSLTEQRQAALSKFGESHAKHPFLANPDDPKLAEPEALDEAFAVYEKRWEAWKAGKLQLKPTPKQVLDELHQRQVRQLKRLGITPAAAGTVAAPAKAGTTTAGKPAQRPRLPEPPKTNGKPPSRDDTRAARIALAKKVTEQQTRGMRA